jgi:hypothetical protein
VIGIKRFQSHPVRVLPDQIAISTVAREGAPDFGDSNDPRIQQLMSNILVESFLRCHARAEPYHCVIIELHHKLSIVSATEDSTISGCTLGSDLAIARISNIERIDSERRRLSKN